MRRSLRVPILLLLSAFIFASSQTDAQDNPASSELRISGDVSKPLALGLADLKKMPRKMLTVANPHDKKTETYEGVLLEELLRMAGVTRGDVLE